jgi:glycosyltransferase involved in cell wall biosynthesis
MQPLSVVIPALNEYGNIPRVIDSVPLRKLNERGWETEILIVDNGSTDGTGGLARELGARVVYQPVRGYGNAYKAGFAHARGEVIATADADLTYPIDQLPELLDLFCHNDIEFMTTDRLVPANRSAMKPSHTLANRALSALSRMLFAHDFRDSQSGMWVFRRYVWDRIDVRSGGMGFSQEIKHAAFVAGVRCLETPIEYRARSGQVKLDAVRDGLRNLRELLEHRQRISAAGRARTTQVEGVIDPTA